MKYTPQELAQRISEGGRKGAALTAEIMRGRRERYLAGAMDDDERIEYEWYVQQRRDAGKRGGTVAARRRRESKVEAANESGT